MSVTISIKTIELATGSHIRIHDLSWLDFEGILAELENEVILALLIINKF